MLSKVEAEMSRPDREWLQAMTIQCAMVYCKEKMKHQEPVGEGIALSMLSLGNLPKYWKGEK